jgi:phosphopantetheinyl transferase
MEMTTPDWQPFDPDIRPSTGHPLIIYGKAPVESHFFNPLNAKVKTISGMNSHQFQSAFAKKFLLKLADEWTGLGPDKHRFKVSENGKPEVLHSGFYFSLAHTSEAFLLLLSVIPCGVDCENRPATPPDPALIRFICQPDEAEWCLKSDTQTRFLYLWTRKEAVMKMTGLCDERRFREIDTQRMTDHRLRQPFRCSSFRCPGTEFGALAVAGKAPVQEPRHFTLSLV